MLILSVVTSGLNMGMCWRCWWSTSEFASVGHFWASPNSGFPHFLVPWSSPLGKSQQRLVNDLSWLLSYHVHITCNAFKVYHFNREESFRDWQLQKKNKEPAGKWYNTIIVSFKLLKLSTSTTTTKHNTTYNQTSTTYKHKVKQTNPTNKCNK